MVKTTLEIPDALFKRAKAAAAQRGVPFRQVVSEALAEKLRDKRPQEKPWMEAFGKLRPLRRETARIQALIDREFEAIEAEDRD